MPIMALGRSFSGIPPPVFFVFDKPRIVYIFYRINIKKSRNNNLYFCVISYGYIQIFPLVVKNLNLLHIQAVRYRKEE